MIFKYNSPDKNLCFYEFVGYFETWFLAVKHLQIHVMHFNEQQMDNMANLKYKF